MLALRYSRMMGNVWKTNIVYHYILTACLLWRIYSCSEASTNIMVVRGADIILYCKLNGTFKLPEWHGPPSEFIYTIQDNLQPNPNILSVKEQRLEWYNNESVHLKIKNVSDKDAGIYACIYTGLGTYKFNLTVTEPVVAKPVTTTNYAPINMPKSEDSKALVWAIPVGICIWLVLCTIGLCLVGRSSLKTYVFSKPLNSFGIIACCYIAIGWIYVIWRTLHTNSDDGRNRKVHEEKPLVSSENVDAAQNNKELETHAAQFIRKNNPKVIEKSGQMTIYSLQSTERTNASNMKTFIIGPDTKADGKETTIMLVGAKNTGKRTFIDGIMNYIMGVDFHHPHRLSFFKDMTSQVESSNAGGWIAYYSFFPESGSRRNYPLHIIDTKGYENKTDGEPGKPEKKLIQDFLSMENNKKICSKIDAICLLLKASDNELTNQINYLNAILELPDIKRRSVKICFLITYSDSKNPCSTQAGKALTKSDIRFGTPFVFSNAIVLEDNSPASKNKWDEFTHYCDTFLKFLDNA